jgi:hypothetical protein
MHRFILCPGPMVCWVTDEAGGSIGPRDRVLRAEAENELCPREKPGTAATARRLGLVQWFVVPGICPRDRSTTRESPTVDNRIARQGTGRHACGLQELHRAEAAGCLAAELTRR